MKVTKTTLGMILSNKEKAYKEANSVTIQAQLKSGKWGKPFTTTRLRASETDEMVVQRYIKNNGREYRIAE